MEKKECTIEFHGGAQTVTGANFLCSAEGASFLVDCGLLQGVKIGDDRNRGHFGYDPSVPEALFVTHAHIDHVGKIPKLVRNGFKGTIYSTAPTKEITELMLYDSLEVLSHEAKRDNLPPLFTEDDIIHTMKLWKDVEYHHPVHIGPFSIVLRDAGHILGSAMVEATYNKKKILFTGDLGNSPAPILKDTEAIHDIDYMVMESVYGDRNHEPKEERREKLQQAILDSVKRGGVLLVPAFSLERTQELLFEINNLVEHHKLPYLPIFLDSPLAIKVTAIYKKYSSYFNKDTQSIIRHGDDIFNFKGLHMTLTTEESIAIKDAPNPKIIMAGSGMSNGGRIVHHEKRYLSDSKNTLLLVGYQAVGTPGRMLEDGVKEINFFGDEIKVRATIVNIRGYSAHKDSDHLLEFVGGSKDTLKKVFIAMTEPKSGSFMAQRISDTYGIDVTVPKFKDKITLEC